MPDNSFDVVSKIELPEVSNAIQQALKEIQQRYDLKGSNSTIKLVEKDNKILLASADDFKLKAVIEILEQKLIKRKVSLKGLEYGVVTPAAGSSVRQEIKLQQGIDADKARKIVAGDQGQQEESASLDPGRPAASRRQGSGRVARSDAPAAVWRFRAGFAVYQLPVELKT